MCDAVDDCDNQNYRGKACSKHYRRMQKYGTYDDAALSKPGPKPDPTKPRSRYGTDRLAETAEGRAQLCIPYQRRPRNHQYVESGGIFNETHCLNGHEYTEENTFFFPEGTRKAGKPGCKICRRNAVMRHLGRPTSDDPVGKANRDKTHCPLGHEYVGDVVYYDSLGNRHCVVCKGINHRRKTYGLEHEDYLAVLEKQNYACAICEKGFDQAVPHVDHDHDTGKVRGLLCMSCNTALGHFRDDADRLRDAAAYIELHNDIAALMSDADITPQDFIGEPTQ